MKLRYLYITGKLYHRVDDEERNQANREQADVVIQEAHCEDIISGPKPEDLDPDDLFVDGSMYVENDIWFGGI